MAYGADGNFWEQLRLGVSPPDFYQLLRDLTDSAGYPDLTDDRGRCHGVRWRVH